MSRWIDADALIESICHTADLGGWIGDTLRNIKRLAVRYINEAPTVEIIRCRECKAYDSECEWCGSLGLEMKLDDFCSYGCNSSEKPNKSEIPTGSERSK